MSAPRTGAKDSAAFSPRPRYGRQWKRVASASCSTRCRRCARRKASIASLASTRLRRTSRTRRREPSATSLGFPDPAHERGSRALVLERDRHYLAAAREHTRRTDDALDRPVTALDEHVGPAGSDERLGRVLVEPGDRIYA